MIFTNIKYSNSDEKKIINFFIMELDLAKHRAKKIVNGFINNNKISYFTNDYIDAMCKAKSIGLLSFDLINNNISNKLGLTHAELWYNNLSDEHKLYVQEIKTQLKK